MESDEAAGTPTSTVPNDSPALRSFLEAASLDPSATLPILADWLEDQNDDRASAVRDLVAMTVHVLTAPALRTCVRAASGPGWTVEAFSTTVRMTIAPDSRIARVLGVKWTSRERLYRYRRSRSAVPRAIEACRLAAVFALFGTYSFAVHNRRVIAASPVTAELLYVLGGYLPSADIVASLASANPARFAELMMLFGRRPSFRHFGEAVIAKLRGEAPR